MPDSRETPPAWPSHQHYPAAPEVEQTDLLDTRRNLAGPRGLEPLPFAAPSLAHRAPLVDAFEPEATPPSEREVQLEAVAASLTPDGPEFPADWETAPLDGLGLVQLVQRLTSTIERRREWIAQAAAQPPAAPIGFAQADFEPAQAEEAVQAMAAFFGSPPAAEPKPERAAEETREAAPPAAAVESAPVPRPEFLRPLPVADEDDGEDAVPDFSLPLRRPAAVPSPVAPAFALADNDAEADEESEGNEEGYSSLLGMGNPFTTPKGEFVRIEEPEDGAELAEPAVVFPGQEEPTASSRLFDPPGKPALSGGEGAAAPATPAPQAPADADAALRAALATLQRMSGAV